ncbi:MAG TPA: GNAT family protein [Bacteroidia bacterium]|nr:GNAT family protein [Bacteroidia bacterium]
MEINKSCFEEFPILTTKRLILRDIRLEDARAIFEMRASGRVNQFISRNNMEEVVQAEQLAAKTVAAWKNRQAIGWAGYHRGRGAIIGTCGFNSIDYLNLRAEIGGEMNVEYWGKQLALEAVSAIVDYGMDVMHLHSIEAKVSPDNRGAIALLEFLKFEKEAHYKDRIYFNGKFMDMAVYTKLSSQR